MHKPVSDYDPILESRALFNHAPIGIIRLDGEARIIDCNPRFLSISGAARQAVIGQDIAEFWGDEQLRPAVSRVLSGKSASSEGEYRAFHLKKKGRVKACFIPVESGWKGVLHAIGFFEEMSGQNRAQEENILKAWLGSTSEGLGICRRKKAFPYLEFTFWNERMSEITGHTREQINELGWRRKMHADLPESESEQDPIRMSFGAEGPISQELEVVRPDGSKRIVRIRAALLEKTGRGAEVLVAAIDVTPQRTAERELKSYRQKLEILVAEQTTELSKTNQLLQLEMSERKRVNTALEKSNRKLQDIIDFLPDATFVIDRERKVIMWNRAIEEMTGVKKEEILGKGDYAHALPFYGQKRPLLIDMAMDTGIENEGRYTYLDRRQETVLAETFVTELNQKRGAFLWGTASLLFDRDRNVIGAIESIRDISDRRRAEQELRRSEERFRAIFESARECIYLKDRSFRFILANPAMAKTFGMTPEELVGKRTQDLYGEEAGRRAEEFDSLVFAGEVVEEEATKPILGVPRTFHIIKVPIRDEAGEIIGLCGISRDITERKQMESQLKEALKFLQTMMDTIPTPVFYKDAEGRYLGCNRAYEACFGLSRDKIIGKSVYSIAPLDLARKYDEMDRALFNELGVQVYETSVRFADGIRREVLFSKSTFNDAAGAPAGIVGVMLDISERKRAEDDLRESEKRFRLMAESIQDVFWMGTPDLRKILYVNPSFERIWGRSRQNLYDSPDWFIESIHPDERESIRGAIEEFSREEAAFDVEYRIVRPDGLIRWIRNRAFPIRDEKGKFHLVTGVARDITERKAAEEALRRSESELRFLSSRLLTAEEEERKRLALDLHDSLGSSLTAINISLESALNRLHAGEMDAAALERGMTLTRLAIEDVRRIIMALRPSMLDDLGLLATIDWFCRQFREVYPNLEVKKIVGIEEKDIPEGLKTVVFRVMQEAFHNVAKYSGADRIKLSLTGGWSALSITIEDNGKGFDVDCALSREVGMKGLGLTSMKERTELSGGSFSIQSEIGKGTRITASWHIRAEGEGALSLCS